MAKLKDSIPLLAAPQRLYGIQNPIIGLTGGIGSGKTTVGKLLMARGLHLINADQLIHEIYREERTISYLKKLAPNLVDNGVINFTELRKVFFDNSLLKSALENYLYEQLPKVFLSKVPKKKTTPLIYDVPLLFEKNLDQKLDLSAVVTCSKDAQIQRVALRDNTDAQTTKRIIENQMSMEEKIKRASYNIENDDDMEALKKETSNFFDHYFLN